LRAIRAGLSQKPLALAVDFNGSARTCSIDGAYLRDLGVGFFAIHDTAGDIAHRIVPEGESLEPCRRLLEELHTKNRAFIAGYVPDCDGDRGNLVVWDDGENRARALEAQEVFALAVLAELAFLAARGADMAKVAVAVNDPTSMRVDEIAAYFGARVFRAEVGEANVVALARRLREDGFVVRPLGEGAAGGVIIAPSLVRDPLDTIGALLKLMALRGGNGAPGLFGIWCEKRGLPAPPADWTLADVLATIPRWTTTGAYCAGALLCIQSESHAALKSRYQKIFLREWEGGMRERLARRGIVRWRAFRYNGAEERETACFGDAGRGGLKIIFYDTTDLPQAALWMRGSGTEPVFRVMAEARAGTAGAAETEQELLNWQRAMTLEADTGGAG
jgi:phosphoglucomutase